MPKSKKKTTRREPALEQGVKKTKIRVIGVGGGGGSIISEIASKGMKKASFVMANTDSQALKAGSRKTLKFQFGQSLTRGLGTGMSAELGREAALQDKEKIKKLVEGQDLCVIVSCLGGGAGSGAAPVFAKVSQEAGNITYAIFTLPFNFEGEKKLEIAKEALEKTKNYLNALSVIPNERVFQVIDKNVPLRQALSAINKFLTDGLEGLIETIYEPGLINIDFADFKTVLEGRGRVVYLNAVEAQRKESSAKDLVERALNSPLYPYGIKGAKGVLFNIAGQKELSLSEVDQISQSIANMASPDAKIIFGVSQSSKKSDLLKTTVLASGCAVKFFPSETKRKPAKRRKRKKSKEAVSPPPLKESPARPSPKAVPQKEKPKKKKRRPIKIKVKSPKPVLESNEKIRKNALQVKQEAEAIEAEMLEQEKFWEQPAFLRRKPESA